MNTTAGPEAAPELFVAFANADVRDPVALDAWLSTSGIGPTRGARSRLERELPAFAELQELVRSVADRTEAGELPRRDQVEALNRVLRDGLHYHELRLADDHARLAATPVGDPFAQARATVAASLARFLAEEDPRRLRRCASDTCRWLFVDRSPGRRRRWCDMKVCGNRTKVRRHRERARGRSSASTA